MTLTNDPAPYWNIWGHYVRAPSTALQALRAELMAKAFTRNEKSKIPGLTPGFAQHTAAVKLAAGPYSDITKRITRCGKLDEHGNLHECRVTLCPRCIMLRRYRETAENRELFAHLGNEGLAFMTVLVKVVDNLDDADELKAKHKLKISNAIRNRRLHDARWNDVYVKGYWELEHYLDNQDLGYNERRTLPELGFPAIGFGNSVWLLHCHAIVALGNITVDELKTALRSEAYDKSFQVDIRPFKTHRDVIDNIKDTTRYSMKYRIEDDYKRTEPHDPDFVHDIDVCNGRKWWPKDAVAALANYLCKPRGGFQAMEFWIGPSGLSKTEVLSGKPQPRQVDGKTGQSRAEAINGLMEKLMDIRANDNTCGGSDAVGSGCDGDGCVVSDVSECRSDNKISYYDTNWLKRWAFDHMQTKSNLGPQQGQLPESDGLPVHPIKPGL